MVPDYADDIYVSYCVPEHTVTYHANSPEQYGAKGEFPQQFDLRRSAINKKRFSGAQIQPDLDEAGIGGVPVTELPREHGMSSAALQGVVSPFLTPTPAPAGGEHINGSLKRISRNTL